MQNEIYTTRNELLEHALFTYIETAISPTREKFVFELNRYYKGTWQLVKHLDAPHTCSSELELAFYKLFKLGVKPPLSRSGLYRALKKRQTKEGEDNAN